MLPKPLATFLTELLSPYKQPQDKGPEGESLGRVCHQGPHVFILL